MPELDKVINGLKACLTYPDECTGDCTTDLCPYRGDCHTNLLNDALALLEVQRPRVLTLDEVITSKLGTVVWLEDFDKSDVISGLLKRVFIYTKVVDFLIVKEEVDNEVTADLEVYGSRWRCWNIKPTDEQRKAVKWDA